MDPSIGNYIKVVVVKIILVEEMRSDPKLAVSSNADETLTSFCKWQHEMNPDNDENPHHHDVAILVTRQDICSQHDTPCRYEQAFSYFYKIMKPSQISYIKNSNRPFNCQSVLLMRLFTSWHASTLHFFTYYFYEACI